MRTAQVWFARFRQGDTSLEDRPPSGIPQTFDNGELRDLVEGDPRKTIGG